MKNKYIMFTKHYFSGTWTYEVHRQKDNAAEVWERVGFMMSTFQTKEEAEIAGEEYVKFLKEEQ